MTRGPKNLSSNYMMHGKIIMNDFLAFYRYKTSKAVYKVKRTFFQWLDLMAAVSGWVASILQSRCSFILSRAQFFEIKKKYYSMHNYR